jgi:putative transposase
VATLSWWRKKFGMMEVVDVKRLKALEKENAELKKMYCRCHARDEDLTGDH